MLSGAVEESLVAAIQLNLDPQIRARGGEVKANGAKLSLRACLKTRFGVPPLGGAAQKPPKGGTPYLLQRVSMVFFKQALRPGQ